MTALTYLRQLLAEATPGSLHIPEAYRPLPQTFSVSRATLEALLRVAEEVKSLIDSGRPLPAALHEALAALDKVGET